MIGYVYPGIMSNDNEKTTSIHFFLCTANKSPSNATQEF